MGSEFCALNCRKTHSPWLTALIIIFKWLTGIRNEFILRTVRLVIQRVKQAQVDVEGTTIGRIGPGMLIFLGVAKTDTPQDADYLIRKITQLRIFSDPAGKMNLSIRETGGEFLVVSQFTLFGDCAQGRRPSFDQAALPEFGEKLYDYFVESLKKENFKVETGRFRAMMDVILSNDGPVTLIVESKSYTPRG